MGTRSTTEIINAIRTIIDVTSPSNVVIADLLEELVDNIIDRVTVICNRVDNRYERVVGQLHGNTESIIALQRELAALKREIAINDGIQRKSIGDHSDNG